MGFDLEFQPAHPEAVARLRHEPQCGPPVAAPAVGGLDEQVRHRGERSARLVVKAESKHYVPRPHAGLVGQEERPAERRFRQQAHERGTHEGLVEVERVLRVVAADGGKEFVGLIERDRVESGRHRGVKFRLVCTQFRTYNGGQHAIFRQTIRACGFCVAAGLGLAADYGGGAQAQSLTPEPATFDVQETPLTAGELAEELGYRYHGNTWKFSRPTFVRVRVWKRSGKAAEVPEEPPADAHWSTLYAPDKPQNELTVCALQKKNETSADNGEGHYTRIEMLLKIRISSRHAPEEVATHDEHVHFAWKGEGRTYTINPDFVKGPEQSFGDVWRYANGSFGVLFEGMADAAKDAANHPDEPVRQEDFEAKLRERAEVHLRTEPLTILYYKGELSVQSDRERQKESGRLYDVPKKRAVCTVILECSEQPFKADPPAPEPPSAVTPTPGP